MGFDDFKRYILRDLIFPKTLVVMHPGLIVNRTVRKFGKGDMKTRTSYYFEDIYSSLYLDSEKKMGRDRADLLWYKIGKDSSLRYLSFLGCSDFSDKIIRLVLEHCFNSIKSTGFSFAHRFSYDADKKFLEVFGKESVICRKTGSGALVAGVVAGVMTHFQNENFEAEATCGECPGSCGVVSHPGIKEKYIADIEELTAAKDYGALNFSTKSFKGFTSFGDLIKFGKVTLDNAKSKVYFEGKALLTSEIGLGELFLKNYVEAGELELFERSVVRSSAVLFRELTEGKSHGYKLKFITNLISGLGWGVPYFKKNGDVIVLSILNPPVTKYGASHSRYVINGFLNEIYRENFKIKNTSHYKVVFEC